MNKPIRSLLLLPTFAFAGGLPPAAEQEIRHLVSYLQASGCRFNRNGNWYSSKEAVEHHRKRGAREQHERKALPGAMREQRADGKQQLAKG